MFVYGCCSLLSQFNAIHFRNSYFSSFFCPALSLSSCVCGGVAYRCCLVVFVFKSWCLFSLNRRLKPTTASESCYHCRRRTNVRMDGIHCFILCHCYTNGIVIRCVLRLVVFLCTYFPWISISRSQFPYLFSCLLSVKCMEKYVCILLIFPPVTPPLPFFLLTYQNLCARTYNV